MKTKIKQIIVTFIALLGVIGVGNAQTTIYESGFETGDPAITVSVATAASSTVAYTTAPITDVRSGQIVATGGGGGKTYNGTFITGDINFTAGKYYYLEVAAKVTGAFGNIRVFKNATATHAAMIASTGGDIISGSLTNNVNSVTATTLPFYFKATATETKKLGFTCYQNGSGGATMVVDDIRVVEYDSPLCGHYCPVSFTLASSYVSLVDFGSITYTSSAGVGYSCNSSGTSVKRTSTYPLDLSVYNATTSTKHLAVWIDWNQDGDFADAGENVYAPNNITVAVAGTVSRSTTVTVPVGATLGNTKMRVGMMIGTAAATIPCPAPTTLDYVDFDVTVLPAPVNMTVAAIAVTQNTDTVNAGTTKNQLLGVKITTSGELLPGTFNSITFNTVGTTTIADIANAKLYTTGTDGTFSLITAVQKGANVAAPNGAFSFTALATALAEGDNYFWLTYDVLATAPTGNVIDASCTNVNISMNATPNANYTSVSSPAITTSAPAGNRPIKATTTMTLLSTTCTQNENPLIRGDVNQQVIGIVIETVGGLSPLSLTQLVIQSNGTVNVADVANCKVYSTGDLPVFNTSSQYGATVAVVTAPGGNMVFNGALSLMQGKNYFWITYDVLAGAGCSSVSSGTPRSVDARLKQMTLAGTTYNTAPFPIAPAGNRIIVCGTPYYSKGNLPANLLTSWSATRNGAGAAPANFGSGNSFFVQNGHSMTTTAVQTISNMYVETGGYITSDHLLTLNNLLIYSYATYQQNVKATIDTYIDTFRIKPNGTWLHNNNGMLPGAGQRIFDPWSIQWFRGIGAGTFPGGTAWGTVIIDSPTAGNIIINANSINNVRGNLEFRAWGTPTNKTAFNYDNTPVTILGSWIHSGGWFSGASGLGMATCNQVANVVINIGEDFIMTGGQFTDAFVGCSKATSGITLNIGGDVVISGGTLNLQSSVATSPNSTINLNPASISAAVAQASSVWNQTGGTVTLGPTNIMTGKTITLTGTSMGNIATGKIITLQTGATLMCETAVVGGAGTFTMQDLSTIGTGNTNGLYSAGATGSVQTTTRQFNCNSSYIYNGGLAQVSGIFTTIQTTSASACPTTGAITNMSVRNLEVRKNANSQLVTLNQDMTVRGIDGAGILTLTLGGLALGPQTLRVANTATTSIVRTNGWVRSETNTAVNPSILRRDVLATGSYLFPYGVSGTEYIPLTVNKTSGTATSISTSTRTTGLTNTPWAGASTVSAVTNMIRGLADSSQTSVIDRWWDISRANATLAANTDATRTLNADLTFSYRGVENTLPVSPNYRTGVTLGVQHWTGTVWNDGKAGLAGTFTNSASMGVATGVGSLTVSGLTEFSPYIVIASPAPLPLNLKEFTGKCLGENVRLSWINNSNNNSVTYTIEKSVDGKEFTVIGEKVSKNDKNEFVDRSPLQANYYRLKVVEKDGVETYSNTINVSNCNNATNYSNIYAFPNPTTSTINIFVESDNEETKNIKVIDMKGALVYESELKAAKQTIQLDMTKYESGIYYIILQDNLGNNKKIKFNKM